MTKQATDYKLSTLKRRTLFFVRDNFKKFFDIIIWKTPEQDSRLVDALYDAILQVSPGSKCDVKNRKPKLGLFPCLIEIVKDMFENPEPRYNKDNAMTWWQLEV